MTKVQRKYTLAFALILLGACSQTASGVVPAWCAHPGKSVISDEHHAILAARKAWYCINWNEEQLSESDWLQGFEAKRIGNTWHIVTILPEGHVGPMIVVHLSRDDGHVIEARLAQ